MVIKNSGVMPPVYSLFFIIGRSFFGLTFLLSAVFPWAFRVNGEKIPT